AAVGGVLVLAWMLNGPRGWQLPAADDAADLFGPSRVWSLHLDVAAGEYDAMQPLGGFAFPGAPPQPPAPKPADGRDGERNLFGMTFPWARADLTADGQTFPKVGLRYAGDGTYLAAARGLKRPLQVQLDRNDKQDFHGLTTFRL